MYPDSYDKKVAAPYLKPSAAMILSHTGYKKGPNAKYSHLNQFFSLHRTGVNFLYADGHVVFMPETIDYVAYRAMATRSGGEVAPAL
jgi:prepilin-type processing-associated H-X9-DG protein